MLLNLIIYLGTHRPSSFYFIILYRILCSILLSGCTIIYLFQTFLNTCSTFQSIPYHPKTGEDYHTSSSLHSCFPSASSIVLGVIANTRSSEFGSLCFPGNYSSISNKRHGDEEDLIANSITPQFSFVFKHIRLFLVAFYMV